MMRPTRDVPMPGEDGTSELVDKPEWKTIAGSRLRANVSLARMFTYRTRAGWLHWDAVPFTGEATYFSWRLRERDFNRGYKIPKIQAIVSFVDCHEGVRPRCCKLAEP